MLPKEVIALYNEMYRYDSVEGGGGPRIGKRKVSGEQLKNRNDVVVSVGGGPAETTAGNTRRGNRSGLMSRISSFAAVHLTCKVFC